MFTTKLAQSEIIPLPTDVGALANRINAGTKKLHNKLDKLMTLKMAIALRDAKIYRQGLQSFYHVFASIEKSLDYQFQEHPNDEFTQVLRQIWRPEVARREKAEQDLLFYYDGEKSKFINPRLSEQVNFSQHILQATKEKPYLLLAYLHVMYLALFAGGRIMRSSVSKALGLFPQKDGLSHENIVNLGTNFFTFDVTDEDALRLGYKRDYELATRNYLSEAQKLEIIDESRFIFEQNAKCVAEIEQHNIQILKAKWSYFAVDNAQYILLAFIALVLIFYSKRIINNFL